jgi:hypothetical protein
MKNDIEEDGCFSLKRYNSLSIYPPVTIYYLDVQLVLKIITPFLPFPRVKNIVYGGDVFK